MIQIGSIKKKIAEGEAEEAFGALLQLMERCGQQESLLYNETIILAGHFKRIEEENRMGLKTVEQLQVDKNQTLHGLLQITDTFAKQESKPQPNPSTAPKDVLRERIEVVSKANAFKYDIFLCFSSKDQEFATILWENLMGYGFEVFISSEYFKQNVGASFQKEIEYALANSKNFLLVYTQNAKDSKWVEIEYEAFFNEFYVKDKKAGRNIYILRTPEHGKVNLPLFARRLQVATDQNSLIESLLKKEETYLNSKGESATSKQKAADQKKKQELEEQQRKEAAAKRWEQDLAKRKVAEAKQKEAADRERLQKAAAAQRWEEALDKRKKAAEDPPNKTPPKATQKAQKKDSKPSTKTTADQPVSDGVFKHFDDLFGGSGKGFGSFFGGNKQKKGPGKHLRITLPLRVEELRLGAQKSIKLKRELACVLCKGSGLIVNEQTCPSCAGKGRIIKEEIVKFVVPPNTSPGSVLKLQGMGNADVKGQSTGDLYISLTEKSK